VIIVRLNSMQDYSVFIREGCPSVNLK